MGQPSHEAEAISVEFFASEEPDGSITGVMMTVPCQCGLHEADTLRIDGNVLLAMKGSSVLPIDLPDLDAANCSRLCALARAGQDLAVGEFTARGLLASYFLRLAIVRPH